MKLFSKFGLLIAMVFSLSVHAELKSFSQMDYEAALKEGKTVVVDFHASWCPTCKKQEPILKDIVSMDGYQNVVIFKADFDKEKDLKKKLMVSKQSTIIVFKGDKEAARKTGVTDKGELKKLIDMGI